MREQMNKNAEVRKLTEQYGTKMAYLIFYLKQLMRDDPNSRVIIFSQVRCIYYIKLQYPFVCVCLYPPFATRPSDRDQISHVWINLGMV